MLRFFIGTLLYLGFAFISPLALVAAPLGLVLLFLRPSRGEALLAIGLLALTAWSIAGDTTGFARIEGAWVCLLAGGTVVALAARPPGEGSMIGSGLLAVGTAAAAAAVLLLVTSFSLPELRWLAERHYGLQARMVLETLQQMAGSAEGGADLVASAETSLNSLVQVVSVLLPALVLLQSVAALAAAWALYRWVARHPEGGPLPALREFRFSDHLIWGVVLALVALVLPGAQALRLFGGNLAAFFGGLYVVRGLGIVAALAAGAGVGGPIAAVMAAVVTIFLLPIVMFGALALGVTDTWIDWRKLALKAKQS